MGLKTNFKHGFIICSLILTGCASNSHVNDPLEPMNRVTFQFNDTLDKYIVKPVAQGYQKVTPHLVQTGVHNFFTNLKYPVVFTNQFLQGQVKLGFQDTGRFLVNSTFGLAGLIDVAGHFGLEEHNEDFGQTFGVWGVSSGPYLVLPILGPSNVRDTAGLVADYQLDPMNLRYINERRATKNRMMALNVVDKRAQLLKAEKLISGDKYTFIRDAYMQKRQDLVLNGAIEDQEDPFLDDDF